MDRRSSTTGDRPDNHIAYTVTGGLNVGICRYNESWKILRRAAQAILTDQATNRNSLIQKAESTQLMFDMLRTPEVCSRCHFYSFPAKLIIPLHPQNFYNHIRRYSNSVILSITYGKRAPRYESYEPTAFFDAQHMWEIALAPGAQPPVDFLPFLKYIPERWAPWKTLQRSPKGTEKTVFWFADGMRREGQEGRRERKLHEKGRETPKRIWDDQRTRWVQFHPFIHAHLTM